LFRSFDNMRQAIVKRDKQLAAANKHLESKVAERTYQLKETIYELEAASKIKNEFLANISHELRTPMNGIIGMISIIESSKLTNEQKGYFKIISDSADELMAKLINILDFTSIEAGKFQLDLKEFNLHEMMDSITSIYSVNAIQKKLEYHCEVDPNIPSRIVGDELRLNQILSNLIENAVKFTSEGRININIALIKLTNNFAIIEFNIHDTGIGITNDKKISLFDSFSQGDSSRTKEYAGIGLGLALSNRLINMMNGEINVESEQGKGTRINIKIVFNLGAN